MSGDELFGMLCAMNAARAQEANPIRELQQAAAALYERSEISASKTAARFKVQREIESAIMAFRPDFIEAAEILDAIRATLERRDMDEETREELAAYGKAFRDALDRADNEVPQ